MENRKVSSMYIGYKRVPNSDKDDKIYLFSDPAIEIRETGLMNRFKFRKGVRYEITFGRLLKSDHSDYPIRIKGDGQQYEIKPGHGIVEMDQNGDFTPTSPRAMMKYLMRKHNIKTIGKNVRKRRL